MALSTNSLSAYAQVQSNDPDYDAESNNPHAEIELSSSSFKHSKPRETESTGYAVGEEVAAANQASISTILQIEHVAIPACYLCVGLVQGLVYALINVYPLDLGATEAQQTTISSLSGMPSCFKIFFGMLSDNVPIFGCRRKPYMLMGFLIASLSVLSIIAFSDLSLERVNQSNISGNSTLSDTSSTIVIPPKNAPSIPLLCSGFFAASMGIWLADTMGDSLVAERAKFETEKDKGNLQLFCYVSRGVGIALTAPLSTIIYNLHNGPLYILTAASMIPLLMMPIFLRFEERTNFTPYTAAEYWRELWRTCSSRAVWQPMGFIFLYTVLFVQNSAWREFLKTVLGFTPNQLNALLLVGGAIGFFGLVLYKLVLVRWSWRWIFIGGILLNGVFSSLQLLLVKGYTFGVSPFLFSVGDDAVIDFILGTQFLPTVVLLVSLVPEGIEGASYALFTTTWNVGEVLRDALSTVLLSIWDVSKPALERGELSGMFRLTVLTTALQVAPILFVWMVPHGAAELMRMNNDSRSRDRGFVGGLLYVTVVILSIGYAIFVSFMNVFHPGWMGEDNAE